jgi:hypothetical protein
MARFARYPNAGPCTLRSPIGPGRAAAARSAAKEQKALTFLARNALRDPVLPSLVLANLPTIDHQLPIRSLQTNGDKSKNGQAKNYEYTRRSFSPAP